MHEAEQTFRVVAVHDTRQVDRGREGGGRARSVGRRPGWVVDLISGF